MNESLTHSRLLSLVRYDRDTGDIVRILPAMGARLDQVDRKPMGNGYKRIGLDKRSYLVHRVAWFYVNGSWPQGNVDHIDGDPSNNRFDNLRDVSQSTNLQNIRKATKGSKSGLLGVTYHKRDSLWRARIMVDGHEMCVGYFKDKHQAHNAYLEAKRTLHPGCTI